MMQTGKFSNGVTRRSFIQKLMKAGSAILVCTSWLAKKAAPRKFVRAVRLGKYPGRVKPLGDPPDVGGQSKWSG
jgi:hypothetical protein